jgi:hypothetical protein
MWLTFWHIRQVYMLRSTVIPSHCFCNRNQFFPYTPRYDICLLLQEVEYELYSWVWTWLTMANFRSSVSMNGWMRLHYMSSLKRGRALERTMVVRGTIMGSTYLPIVVNLSESIIPNTIYYVFWSRKLTVWTSTLANWTYN